MSSLCSVFFHLLLYHRITNEYSEMSQHCMTLAHLLSLKPLHDILLHDIPFFGPDLKPVGVRYSCIGGKRARFAQVTISTNSQIFILTKDEKTELKDYFKHNSLITMPYQQLVNDFFNQHFDINALKNPNNNHIRLLLLDGINYEANEESGLGSGRVYATPRHQGGKFPRHDFVVVKVQIIDAEGHPVFIDQVAQAIAFFDYQTKVNGEWISKFFILAQTFNVLPMRSKYHPEYFSLLEWERHPEHSTRHFMMLEEVEVVQGAAFVIPCYKDKNAVRTDMITKSSFTDNYWYIHRKFMDRSGYEEEVILEWGNDDNQNLDRFLQEQLVHQTGSVREMIFARGNGQREDIGIDSDSELDSLADEDASDYDVDEARSRRRGQLEGRGEVVVNENYWDIDIYI